MRQFALLSLAALAAWLWRHQLMQFINTQLPALMAGNGSAGSGPAQAAAWMRDLYAAATDDDRTFLQPTPDAPLTAAPATRQERMQRALRNKNPGNIKDAPGNPWQGKIGVDDGGFVQFSSNVYGLRALARILRNYQADHGLSTIDAIVRRYAPPAGNPTAAYIKTVANVSGYTPSQVLNLADPAVLERLMLGIIRHETGMPWPVDEIRRGIELEGTA